MYTHYHHLAIDLLVQELHRDRGRLEKARVVKEAEMEEHQARCNEIQVLKFGQLIDLEMVDKVCGCAGGNQHYVLVLALFKVRDPFLTVG